MRLPTARISSDSRHVLIAANPMAGARAAAARVAPLAELLTRAGLICETETDLERLSERAIERLQQGALRAVVAAGGDGTVSALVNRLPAEAPLAIFPLGTENLLSKYVGQRATPSAVCSSIVDGYAVRLDAGQAGDRLFLLMCSAGFDAEVVRRVGAARRGHITHMSWLKPIWQTVRTYQYPEMRLCLTGTDRGDELIATLPAAARWVFVVNLPCYARGLTVAPDAHGADGQLDVCTFGGGSFGRGLNYLLHIARRRHHRLSDCCFSRCTQVRLESEVAVPFQTDGDPAGWLPVDVKIVPERFTLVVPRRFLESF